SMDILVLAERSVFWGGKDRERNWGYAEHPMDLRRRVLRQLGHFEAPDPDVSTFLTGLGREVVVVARRRFAAGAARTWLAPPERAPEFDLLYRNPEIALYRWRPSP